MMNHALPALFSIDGRDVSDDHQEALSKIKESIGLSATQDYGRYSSCLLFLYVHENVII